MTLRAILTLIFTATFVGSPYVTPPFTGFRADQLPIPQIDPPIQPEGYAFAIWGLIYGWLVVSALFGLVARRADVDWHDVRLPLTLSLAVGTPWLWVAGQSAIGATVLIFAMLGLAVWALVETPARDRWWLRAPVAIYAGWLTAASFVSLGATAAGYGVLLDANGWAWAGIAGALIVAIAIQRRVQGAPEYGLTVIWALIAIVAKNAGPLPEIAAFATAGAVVIAAVSFGNRWERSRATP